MSIISYSMTCPTMNILIYCRYNICQTLAFAHEQNDNYKQMTEHTLLQHQPSHNSHFSLAINDTHAVDIQKNITELYILADQKVTTHNKLQHMILSLFCLESRCADNTAAIYVIWTIVVLCDTEHTQLLNQQNVKILGSLPH